MRRTGEKMMEGGEKAEEVVAMMTTTKDKEKKKRKFEKKLVKFKNLPEYLQDNEYIVDYYRCEWPLKESLLSVFSLHNESLNIWTHLGGFLIFLGLTVMSCIETTELGGFITGFSRRKNSGASMMMMMKNKHEFNVSDKTHMLPDAQLRHISPDSALSEAIPRWPWFVFLSGAMGCLVCSSMSHLLASHSKSFNIFFWRLDYAGIALMIVCSFVAPIYYVFYCNPFPQFFYITSITVIGVVVIATLLTPTLSSPRYRPFRATLFLIMGLLGIIPAGHAVSIYWGNPEIIISLSLELVMAVLYGIGVVFYVTRIPERWKPGAFDIAGHSHQIFHLFVVLAALAHCAATLIILDFRHRSPSCAS